MVRIVFTMTAIISCITLRHDLWLVGLAAIICALGCHVTIRLFDRARSARGLPRAGWLFMDAVAAGSSIWTTHFVAMLAFDPGVPMTFDPQLTMGSLLVAIAGTFIGVAIGVSRLRAAFVVGGGVVGAATAAMHYLGMAAYRVDGLIAYNTGYVAASVALAVLVGALAFALLARKDWRWSRLGATGLLLLAIVSLHFTGMTAVEVTPMVLGVTSHGAAGTMGLAVAGVSLLVLGTAISAYAIDSRTLDENAARLRRLADATAEGLAVVRNGRIEGVNMPFERLVGLSAAAICTRHISDFIDESAPHRLGETVETAIVAGTGERIPVELSVRSGVLGPGTLVYAVRDIRERIAHDARIRHLALHDALTDLPNRRSFTERLAHELAAVEAGERLALISIDLDGFKEVNDLRGHAVGDAVLRTIGARLATTVGDGEFVARVGGDEFAAVKRFRHEQEVLGFAERLRAALLARVLDEDVELATGGSIGIAIHPDDARTAEDLVGKSDLAMYRAKASIGEGVIAFYREDMDEVVRTNRQLARDLKSALAEEQFERRYQVQTDVRTGEVTGFEVLLRWRHPTLGFVSPAEFIPIAEESGLILPIGEWVLRMACRTAATWPVPHRIAVNLSPVQLAHQDLPALVHEVLIESGLQPGRLELEITESTLISDMDQTLHVLRRIKALGVSIAMDDFGTGYSSLSTLRAFPFDKIKLDRSFMGEVEENAQARAIVRAVLALGESLDVPVLAEGVETPEQLAFLRKEGCDEAQGYLLGRPVPLEDVGTVASGAAAALPPEMEALPLRAVG